MLSFNDISHITGGKILRHENSTPLLFLLQIAEKLFLTNFLCFLRSMANFITVINLSMIFIEKGVRQFIVEESETGKDLPDANILLVQNSIHALQQIAGHHRNKFDLKLIGITGK